MADPYNYDPGAPRSGWNGNSNGYGYTGAQPFNTPIPFAGLSTVPAQSAVDPNYDHGAGSFLNNNGILIPAAIKYRQQALSQQGILANLMAEWGKRLSAARLDSGKKGGAGLTPSAFSENDNGEYTINGLTTLDGKPFSDKDWEKWKQEAENASDEKAVKSQEELLAEAALAEVDSFMKALNVKAEVGILPDDPNAPKVPDKNAPGTAGKPIEVGLSHLMAAIANQESSSGYRPTWASGNRTANFGATEEVRDGAYTDENGNQYAHFNKGWDVGLPVGTKIDAAVAGEVVGAGRLGDGWGVSVKIKDAQGNIHSYGHLSQPNVKVGDKISAGQIIGLSGDSADPIPGTDMVTSTGAHLSYDVRKPDGFFIAPDKVLGDGGYNKSNPSGAFGRYQIMPDSWREWVVEFGLGADAPPTPENQEYIAQKKMSQYLARAGGDIAKAAAWWYAGPGSVNWTEEQLNAPQVGKDGTVYPSVMEYGKSVQQKATDFAKNGVVGYQTADGTWITNSSSGAGSSGSSGSSSPPKKPDPQLDYLNSGAYKLEGERADEIDRRYDNVAKRMKDYLSAAGVSNDLLADIQNAIGNEVALKQKNQSIQDSAISTAASNNAAVRAGKLDYRDELAGSIWSNSLAPFEQELQAIRAQMQTAPTGFADSILRTIPRDVPMEYWVDNELGLSSLSKNPSDYWGVPTQQRYALGTIPRYAAGTLPFHLEPFLAAYQAGNYVPSQQVRQFEELGYKRDGTTGTPATGTTPTNTGVIPAAAVGNSTYRPGFVPKNATLPPDMRVYDDGEWLDRVVDGMLANISAGRSAAPASWGLGDLSIYHGQPASSFPGSLRQAIRSTVAANADSPEIVQMFGARPGIETQWVPDPNAAPTKATPGTGGGGNYGTGANTQAQYGGTYGGSMDAYESAKLDLEKQQLALQRQVAEAQIKLDRDRYELEILKNTDAQAYQAAQIRWNDAKAALDEKNYALSVTQSELQKQIFEDSVRRYEIETGMAREKLDLDKIRQAADLEYQAGQLELARAAGALSQAEYEEKKRQFEVTFGYQKEKDKKEQDMQRAKITVDYMAKPGNAVASNFWYGNREDPVGTAYDLFSGEDRGQKTWQQAYEEDATLYADANRPVNTYADGSMNGFMHDIAAILGDSQGNRATGNEEVVYNPTGAPLMVLSNEMSRALGFVPNRGKQFGNHVRKGGAA